MGKRNYPLKRIKYWYAYDIDEVCGLYKDSKLHPRTVHGWIKNGLATIDGQKPFLVFGHELKRFLGKQNASGKQKTARDEMFCFKCRDVRKPYKREIQFTQRGHLTSMKALCPDCKNTMNKGVKLDDVPSLKRIFTVVDVLKLYDCEASTVNTHLLAQTKAQQSESFQHELF